MTTPTASVVARWFPASPLRHAAFRRFYIGSIGAALGYTMQSTVAAWLMATLTPSALMVALVQTASTAPSLLFGLAAGALADIVDRRRIILVDARRADRATAALGVAEITGIVGPVTLLASARSSSAPASRFYLPAQQASVNDIVARAELPRAVSLGAVAFNVARALGPALAGAIAAWLSSGSAFLVAARFLRRDDRRRVSGSRGPGRPIPGVPETLLSGIQSGLRYARHSAPLRSLIIRNLSFSFCASALWALLPLVARDQLALGAGGYGTLMASFGVGRHRRRARDSATDEPALAEQHRHLGRRAVGGRGDADGGDVDARRSRSSARARRARRGSRCSRASRPERRARRPRGCARAPSRPISSTNQASLALGSVLWGVVATHVGTRSRSARRSPRWLLLLALNRRVRVAIAEEADVTPGAQAAGARDCRSMPAPDDGPVLIQIEYRIAPRASRRVPEGDPHGRSRRGAATAPAAGASIAISSEDGRFVERFVIASWAEYTRLRTRMTQTDRRLQDSARDNSSSPTCRFASSRYLGVGRDDLPTPPALRPHVGGWRASPGRLESGPRRRNRA